MSTVKMKLEPQRPEEESDRKAPMRPMTKRYVSFAIGILFLAAFVSFLATDEAERRQNIKEFKGAYVGFLAAALVLSGIFFLFLNN